MSVEIEFVEWAAHAGMDVRPRSPVFRVHAEAGFSMAVHLLLSLTQLVNLGSDLGIKITSDLEEEEEGDKTLIDRALLRFGVRWLESAIREGVIPGEHKKGAKLQRFVAEEDLPLLIRLAGHKDCDYQILEGRDLYCTASSRNDKTALGASGLRWLAPTSRPLCAACELPDADYICAHLHHPTVHGSSGAGHPLLRRKLVGAVCDLNRNEIGKPGACRPADNRCWTRITESNELTPVEPVGPNALPEAIDYFALAWRVAVGKPLLRLRAVSDASSLAVPATTRAEVESRLSDLADIVKNFNIPDDLLEENQQGKIAKDQTLVRIESALRRKLSPEDFEQAKRLLGALRAMNKVRVAFQHTAASDELPAALASLGIAYPPTDWGSAWEDIRARITAALRELAHIVQRGAE
jgi:hypothetical protein